MPARAFLDSIVKPNVAEFKQSFADLRHAYNAISSIDSLAAHMFEDLSASGHASVNAISSDSHYRQTLATQDVAFLHVRDIAKAQKHVRLTQHNPVVTSADQISSRAVGWGEGGWGQGRYGGVDQVVADLPNGDLIYIEEIVDDALKFLEEEMANVGL